MIPEVVSRKSTPSRSVNELLTQLKQCRDLNQGKQLYKQALEAGLRLTIHTATILLNLYTKCGCIRQARAFFERMPAHSLVSWSLLISGYTRSGSPESALTLFWSMIHSRGYQPNSATYVAALGAASVLAAREEVDDSQKSGCRPVKLASLEKTRRIHSHAQASGCESDLFVANTLLDCYCKCGCLAQACALFRSMKVCSLVSWTALILGCAENREGLLGLNLYTRLLLEGIELDCKLLVAAIMACGSAAARDPESTRLSSLERGMKLHSQILSFRSWDIFVGNALLDMYSKCGSMMDACKCFSRMPSVDVVSWTSLVLGHAENGDFESALETFELMLSSGTPPNDRTFVAALKACGGILESDPEKKKKTVEEKVVEVHRLASGTGFDSDTYVATSLLDLYSKCGMLDHARGVFDRIYPPTIVSWNAMMFGYVENGEYESALELFFDRRGESRANTQTYSAALMACGELASFQCGKVIHGEVIRAGLENEVAPPLMNFYSKCGSVTQMQMVFDCCWTRETPAWTTLIAGYSLQGDADVSFHLFRCMEDEGAEVDDALLLSILTSCSRSGLVDVGKKWFDEIVKRHGVVPGIEHYNCMVDMLGRANRVEEALEMVRGMPVSPNVMTWRTLLGGCAKWKNAEVGKFAFDSLMKMDERGAGSYVLMANLLTVN